MLLLYPHSQGLIRSLGKAGERPPQTLAPPVSAFAFGCKSVSNSDLIRDGFKNGRRVRDPWFLLQGLEDESGAPGCVGGIQSPVCMISLSPHLPVPASEYRFYEFLEVWAPTHIIKSKRYFLSMCLTRINGEIIYYERNQALHTFRKCLAFNTLPLILSQGA